ncbi:MAG: Crp/Fnr family transcriptional regulator [Saprospiraceae bacterium]|jgi:CRP/FNR family transcriptional regulator|nr:Crp/Fnr family transcriptional regulator [Saprospiraceae bacterium]MCC6844366.1 Crp/Fnr family transcriptional regulator [Saprospiraceae bacterium]HRG33648.1 Crp/Fnr family transcriptional regulator [Saprospiraceae bacterium]
MIQQAEELNLLNFETPLLNKILENGQIREFKAMDSIIDTGQIISYMPIVLSGLVKVSRVDEEGRELLLYYIHPNEGCAFTFSCCTQRSPSEIKAVAEENSKLLMVPVHLMDEWLTRYQTWKAFVMQTMSARFTELLKTIDQVAFQNLDIRLVNYLKQKTKSTGSSLVNLSHKQIAEDLNTNRVVISRLLKKLEDQKKILLYRNQIKILRAL